jgi:hypothetical protein
MKVGMIFGCMKDGADHQVCRELTRRLNDKIVISPVTLGDKKNLIADCGKSVRLLLEKGNCDRVLVIWDLRPPHPEHETKLDCIRECNLVKASLTAEGVNLNNVSLISIREELEAWLCADRATLIRLLSTETHEAEVPRFKDPERVKNPKAQFMTMFRNSPRYSRRYSDLTDAVRIARECDLARLEKVQSFARFKAKLM